MYFISRFDKKKAKDTNFMWKRMPGNIYMRWQIRLAGSNWGSFARLYTDAPLLCLLGKNKYLADSQFLHHCTGWIQIDQCVYFWDCTARSKGLTSKARLMCLFLWDCSVFQRISVCLTLLFVTWKNWEKNPLSIM